MAVGAFGIQSQAMGRGDLFAAGRRFSVNAYFKAGSAALHHGTLYVDTALDQMSQFLSAGGGDLAAPNPPDTAAHTCLLYTSFAQHAIGTPVFRQLNGGFDQMALMHFQFTFKQFEPVSYTHLDVYKRQPQHRKRRQLVKR